MLVLCGVAPAVSVWQHPHRLTPAIGLSLCAFLLLSPAFGVQYAAWPAAVSYLIGLAPATLYNLTAGAMLFAIYDRWSGGLPWTQAHTHASRFLDSEVTLGVIAWCALLLVTGTGGWRLIAGNRAEPHQPRGRARPSHANGSGC